MAYSPAACGFGNFRAFLVEGLMVVVKVEEVARHGQAFSQADVAFPTFRQGWWCRSMFEDAVLGSAANGAAAVRLGVFQSCNLS